MGTHNMLKYDRLPLPKHMGIFQLNFQRPACGMFSPAIGTDDRWTASNGKLIPIYHTPRRRAAYTNILMYMSTRIYLPQHPAVPIRT